MLVVLNMQLPESPLFRNPCPQIDTESIIMSYCIIHQLQLVLTMLPQLELLVWCCFGYGGRNRIVTHMHLTSTLSHPQIPSAWTFIKVCVNHDTRFT